MSDLEGRLKGILEDHQRRAKYTVENRMYKPTDAEERQLREDVALTNRIHDEFCKFIKEGKMEAPKHVSFGGLVDPPYYANATRQALEKEVG